MGRTITFKGETLHLAGRRAQTGMTAPEFEVINRDLAARHLRDYAGKIKVMTTFLSLDTSVCSVQVKEFNRRAAGGADDVVVMGISKDLPFAQKRFCDMNGIDRVEVVSDYKTGSFGINYGLLIQELGLLARSVLILDRQDNLRYIQIVPEATDLPDYDTALAELEKVVAGDPASAAGPAAEGCEPCRAGAPVMSRDEIDKSLSTLEGWELEEDRKIIREFRFKGFRTAVFFSDMVANIAEQQDHHPEICVDYNKVRITLWTHKAGGLTENDFILARLIDASV